jgi:hypothetical protein
MVNIIQNRQKLKVIHLRSGTKQGCPLLAFLFITLPEHIQHKQISSQKKAVKVMQIKKEVSCSSLQVT